METIDTKHRHHFTNLYLMAIADGHCDDAELAFLYELGARKGLTSEQIGSIIENPHKARFIKPDSLFDAIEQLYDLGQMVCADGKIHPYEVELCKAFSKKFDIKDDIIDEVVESLIDEVYARMKTSKNVRSEIIINKILGIVEKNKQLSPLEINSQNRIFLPGYNNAEVKMTPLPKSVYFLFLKNLSGGICLKRLSEYKKELFGIYCRITNKSENQDIEESINNLVDTRTNSIHENLSRINQAIIVSLPHKNNAASYCIKGSKGEPYKIALPNHLVRFCS